MKNSIESTIQRKKVSPLFCKVNIEHLKIKVFVCEIYEFMGRDQLCAYDQ